MKFLMVILKMNQSDWKNRIVGKKEGVLLADAKGINIYICWVSPTVTFMATRGFPKHKKCIRKNF